MYIIGINWAGVAACFARRVNIGVSDWPAWEVAEANTTAELRGWTPFVALQSRYNMLDRTTRHRRSTYL